MKKYTQELQLLSKGKKNQLRTKFPAFNTRYSLDREN